MTQRKGLRGILALLCAMTLLIGAIGPAAATEAAVPESVAVTTAAAPENTPAPSAQTPKGVIASWQWVDPDKRVNQGVMEVSDKEGAVDYNGVYSLLPKEITATVEGQTAPVTIAVKDWHCPEFDASVPGDYTFKAEIAQDYTLGGNVPALEVKVRLIQEQPVADAPADTTGDTTTDTTGNTTAPTDSTPPAADVITVESWIWVDSMQALSDDGKLHLTEEITDANLPEIQKLLPQSIQAGEHTISLIWNYSKETKTFTAKLPDGYALKEGAAPLAVAVVVEEVMVLPEGASTLYVGETDITTGGYWKTTADGKLEPGSESDYNVHYDGNGTLTLNGATIQGGTSTVSVPYGAGIYAQCNSGESVSLTIELIGENTITGYYGIYVNAEISADSNGTDASLTITGENNGSLEVSGSNHGIFVISGTGNASLNIEKATVTSSTNGGYAAGVCVQSSANATGSPNISLSVNGGSLTASGTGSSDGIWFYVGSSQATNATTSLTVSNNALVRAQNGIKASRVDKPTPSGTGIVFDGKNGTVYGNVTLQEDLTINQGETLTIPDGASLTTNDKLIVNGGTVNGTPTGNVTYLVTGVTLDKDQLTLLPGDSAELKATVKPDNATDKTVTWESDKPEVATVADGKVTAVKSGTATITAKTADGSGKTATCAVTVNSGISANPAALDFGSVATNYSAAPKAQTVTITNNTKAEVTLNQPTATTTNYEIGELSETVLASGKTATFTVQPKTGLALGEHKETITVSSTAGDVTIDVSFNVVQLSLTFKNYTGKTYDGKAMANPTKDQLTVTGADFSEVTFTWYKDAKAEENKLTSAPADAGTYVLVAAVAKTDSHEAAEAQQTITIAKADATDAMKKAEGTLTKNHPDSLALPKLPDGASYGIPTAEGTYVTDLAVKDGKLSYKGTGNVKNDGKYEVRVPVTGAKNYSDYTIVVTLTGEDKLPVTLTAANFTTTYNGSAVFPEAIHKTATCDGQAVSGTWSFVGGNPKDANVDESAKEQTKVLKFTPKDTEKYAEASIEVKVVIKKAPLKVSVKLSKTKIAVNSKLPTVSLSYSGLMGNDKMEPKVEPKFEGMPSGKKTGTYTIKLKNVDEMKEAINDLPVSKNYDITYVTSAKLSVVSGNNPLTADTSNIGMWTAIMIISGIGLIVVLVVMVVLNKKSKRRRPRYRRTPPKQED